MPLIDAGRMTILAPRRCLAEDKSAKFAPDRRLPNVSSSQVIEQRAESARPGGNRQHHRAGSCGPATAPDQPRRRAPGRAAASSTRSTRPPTPATGAGTSSPPIASAAPCTPRRSRAAPRSTSPGTSSSSRARRTSTATGRQSPPTASPPCALKPAALPTTAPQRPGRRAQHPQRAVSRLVGRSQRQTPLHGRQEAAPPGGGGDLELTGEALQLLGGREGSPCQIRRGSVTSSVSAAPVFAFRASRPGARGQLRGSATVPSRVGGASGPLGPP